MANRETTNGGGSSNTAIVAILIIVLLGLLVFFLFFRSPGGDATDEVGPTNEPDVELNVDPDGNGGGTAPGGTAPEGGGTAPGGGGENQ